MVESSSGGVVSRRTFVAVGTGLAGLAAAGCTVNNPVSRTRSPAAPAKLAPDVTVASRALAEITAVRTATTRTIARHPGVRSGLVAVVGMHRAHEHTLTDAVPAQARPTTAPAPYAVPHGRAKALRRLAARERHLHATLDGLALRAQSGDFARLLASMGAAVSQRLSEWPS